MCLLVSFKRCFNQSRFNNHDQSQVSTQVSSNHDHCFNTGLNSTPLVQGAMVPTAKEMVEDEALPWAEPMEDGGGSSMGRDMARRMARR